MPDYYVVEELRDYLIIAGAVVAQTATGAATTTLPTVWIDPRDGAPQPRWDDANARWQEDITVTIVDQMTAGPDGGMEDWTEETFVDVIVRSRNQSPGRLVHRTIRGLLHPVSSPSGKSYWTMGNLLVQRSSIWRSEQQVGVTPIDYTRTASYRFECRRKSLAGTPYVP